MQLTHVIFLATAALAAPKPDDPTNPIFLYPPFWQGAVQSSPGCGNPPGGGNACWSTCKPFDDKSGNGEPIEDEEGWAAWKPWCWLADEGDVKGDYNLCYDNADVCKKNFGTMKCRNNKKDNEGGCGTGR